MLLPLAEVDGLFGPKTMDRFAPTIHMRVASGRFISLYFEAQKFEPASEGVDAFAHNWRCYPSGMLENNWVHRLIGKTICHLTRCRPRATLVLPVWLSTHWWPLCIPILSRYPTLALGPSTAIRSCPPGSIVPETPPEVKLSRYT